MLITHVSMIACYGTVCGNRNLYRLMIKEQFSASHTYCSIPRCRQERVEITGNAGSDA